MNPLLNGIARTWICLTVLESLALCGCGSVTLHETTAVTRQSEIGAKLEPGTACDGVRIMLGEPWLASEAWGFDVYRADDKRSAAIVAVVLVVPVPAGWGSEKRQGFVLVTYDEAKTVAQVAAGSASRGILASDATRWMTIKAGAISAVVDPQLHHQRTTILADAALLPGYIARRRQAAECTVVVGCDGTGGCPDQFSIDGGTIHDPAPIEALCAPAAPCPAGTHGGADHRIAQKDIVRVPVLHVLGVSPGSHRLRATSSRIEGEGRATFDCAAGEAVYMAVRSEVVRASKRGPKTLQATITPSATAPGAWAGYNVVLFRDDRWLVDR
ncbi:MAG: hypothetical protein KBD01_08355 [Acidobacteria bacterium]|nr:hypothetical protein [Acidobacteriota bacterium]